jgi:hypothetical protein
MTPSTLLTDLSRAGIVLTAANGRLAYDAPRGAMTPALLLTLKEHKREVIALLQRPQDRKTTAPEHEFLPPDAATSLPEAWFQLGALAPRREQFAYDPETKTHPEWWDYLYELHNRGLVAVNGKIMKEPEHA